MVAPLQEKRAKARRARTLPIMSIRAVYLTRGACLMPSTRFGGAAFLSPPTLFLALAAFLHRMTPNELRDSFERLFGKENAVECAAETLRCPEQTVQKWLAADATIPGPVAAAIELAFACPIPFLPKNWHMRHGEGGVGTPANVNRIPRSGE